ncbi:MAG: hypothetical protein ACRD3A_15435 [Terriglobales bacterium]
MRTGRTYADIGREYGFTDRWIRRIAADWGLSRPWPLPRVTIRCAHCGKQVVTTITVPRRFCSKRCFYRSRRGKHWTRSPEARARWIAARTRSCLNCGKDFLVPFPHLARRFCSWKCSGEARAKLTRQDLAALRAALRTRQPRREIAAQFGITRAYVYLLAARWRKPSA